MRSRHNFCKNTRGKQSALCDPFTIIWSQYLHRDQTLENYNQKDFYRFNIYIYIYIERQP